MDKTVFDLNYGKQLLSFFSYLALKNFKNTFPPVAGLKNILKKFLFADFRVTVNIFWGPATS